MQPESPRQPNDDERRIDELEAQVKELSGLVEILLSRPEGSSTPLSGPVARKQRVRHARRSFYRSIRQSIQNALGADDSESLESRIGGIWLGKIVAVLFVTLFVLGALITLRDETLPATWKIGIGYGLAALTIGVGLFRRNDASLFLQTLLGSGLAALYFTTYALFFIDATQLVDQPRLGLVVLFAALIAVATVAHWRRSETTAGLALFLSYYTVALSLTHDFRAEQLAYAFVTYSSLALIALIFHLTHRWLFFSWGAMLATHASYLYFFVWPQYVGDAPWRSALTSDEFFWFSTGFLTWVFCLFSVACVTDAHRFGRYRRAVVPMALVNSVVYITLTWGAFTQHYPGEEWIFRFIQASLFAVFTAYAFFAGRPHNVLYQVFAVKTVIVFTLALEGYLPTEWLLIAMATECLVLGLIYRTGGVVIFKALDLVLLAIVFAVSLFLVQSEATTTIRGYTIPIRWFSAGCVAYVLSIVAWYYHHYGRRWRPTERHERGQWVLADSRLDASGSTMALLHAAAGALILAAVTIVDFGDDPRMPFMLAGEAICFAIIGLILAAPQVEIASVLLLIASHACFHLFLLFGIPGFETQPNYTMYTLSVAVLTFLCGYLWERYLKRIEGGMQWEHDALASIPFIAASLMVFTLAERSLEAYVSPVVGMALAMFLLLGSAITRLAGLRVAGMLTVVLATASYYSDLIDRPPDSPLNETFGLGVLAMLLGYAASERACRIWERRHGEAENGVSWLRNILISIAMLTGLLGLWRYAPDRTLSLYWMGHAVGAMALGVFFRERRYRWAGIAILIAALGRYFVYDLQQLQLVYKFLSTAALLFAAGSFWWGYNRFRMRSAKRRALEEAPGVASEDAVTDV